MKIKRFSRKASEPSSEDAFEQLRTSVDSAQTLGSGTTRASSVMPITKPNLGLTLTQSQRLDSKEIKEHYDRTEAGVKNLEFGSSILPELEATTMNKETSLVLVKAMQAQWGNDESAKRGKTKRVRFRLSLVLVILAVFAGVAVGFFFFSEGNDIQGIDQEEEEQDSDGVPENQPDEGNPDSGSDFEPIGGAPDLEPSDGAPDFEPTFFPEPSNNSSVQA